MAVQDAEIVLAALSLLPCALFSSPQDPRTCARRRGWAGVVACRLASCRLPLEVGEARTRPRSKSASALRISERRSDSEDATRGLLLRGIARGDIVRGQTVIGREPCIPIVQAVPTSSCSAPTRAGGRSLVLPAIRPSSTSARVTCRARCASTYPLSSPRERVIAWPRRRQP